MGSLLRWLPALAAGIASVVAAPSPAQSLAWPERAVRVIVRAVADSAAVKERLGASGMVARGSTPAEFGAAIDERRRKVAAIAAIVGAKPRP